MQLSAKDVSRYLPWDRLIDALDKIFTSNACAPLRHHHSVPVPGTKDATMLLMPAWLEGEFVGVKLVNVFPGNSELGLPGLSSNYTLSCGKTGRPLLQLDGNELTARRTAAASALASRYLSRDSSKVMLMMGAGRMARKLIPAHRSVRDIDEIWVWNHNEVAAQKLVDELAESGVEAHLCSQGKLEQVASRADIISCATLAETPIVSGQWLKPGAHLDLVGSFTPKMREADNLTMQMGHIFVDTRYGALHETGDLITPLKENAITERDILAEFADLCGGRHRGRKALDNPDEAITVFKSVGDSREDLAGAMLAYQSCTSQGV